MFAQGAEVEFEVGHLATACSLLQQMFAAVALAPLDQHKAKRQLAVAVIEGEILVDQLLLQCHGGSGDHQLFLGQSRDRDRSLSIGEGLADTGACLGHQNTALFVILPSQRFGYLGNQKILFFTRHKTGQAIRNLAVGLTNGGFEAS